MSDRPNNMAGVRPCQHCGSSAAIVETDNGRVKSIRRLCCGVDPWWRSSAGRDWFSMHGIDLDGFAARLAAREAVHG